MVVVDETLLETVDVTAGLKEEGAIVINSERPAAELRPLLQGYEGRVCTVDAGAISEQASGGLLPQHPHAGRHRGGQPACIEPEEFIAGYGGLLPAQIRQQAPGHARATCSALKQMP